MPAASVQRGAERERRPLAGLESGKPEVVTHRVAARIVDSDSGESRLTTQDEASSAPDLDPVRPVQVRAEVWYAVPYLGWVNLTIDGRASSWAIPTLAGALFIDAAGPFGSGVRDQCQRRGQPLRDQPERSGKLRQERRLWCQTPRVLGGEGPPAAAAWRDVARIDGCSTVNVAHTGVRRGDPQGPGGPGAILKDYLDVEISARENSVGTRALHSELVGIAEQAAEKICAWEGARGGGQAVDHGTVMAAVTAAERHRPCALPRIRSGRYPACRSGDQFCG